MNMEAAIAVLPSSECNPSEYRDLLTKEPRFGTAVTDHMFTSKWRKGCGWYDLRVGSQEAFSVRPACAMLHYAREILEGMFTLADEFGALVPLGARRASAKRGIHLTDANGARRDCVVEASTQPHQVFI